MVNNIDFGNADVKVFASHIEDKAIEQIKSLANSPLYPTSRIRIMPDVHPCNDTVVGLTIDIDDKFNPALIGADIGCGIYVYPIEGTKASFDTYNGNIYRHKINELRIQGTKLVRPVNTLLEKLRCEYNKVDVAESFGTLGGGNHYIELGIDEKNWRFYGFVHSGSRALGGYIYKHYMKLAKLNVEKKKREGIENIIKTLKDHGQESLIETTIKDFCESFGNPEPYIEGQDLQDYINDCNIAIEFAKLNREDIARKVFSAGDFRLGSFDNPFHSIHNYLDGDYYIVRKGACSADFKQKLVIALNAVEGMLICEGLGNPDWNNSAPHGAGRVYSRTEAKNTLNLEEEKAKLEGVYTNFKTSLLDEAPGAYKKAKDIVRHISPTVKILTQVKPIYNYKNEPITSRNTQQS